MDPNNRTTPADLHVEARMASDQANRCRRLAQSINDRETARILEDMADQYERRGSGVG